MFNINICSNYSENMRPSIIMIDNFYKNLHTYITIQNLEKKH